MEIDQSRIRSEKSLAAKEEKRRKSVSFIDEKLIINAIQSTSINENGTYRGNKNGDISTPNDYGNNKLRNQRNHSKLDGIDQNLLKNGKFRNDHFDTNNGSNLNEMKINVEKVLNDSLRMNQEQSKNFWRNKSNDSNFFRRKNSAEIDPDWRANKNVEKSFNRTNMYDSERKRTQQGMFRARKYDSDCEKFITEHCSHSGTIHQQQQQQQQQQQRKYQRTRTEPITIYYNDQKDCLKRLKAEFLLKDSPIIESKEIQFEDSSHHQSIPIDLDHSIHSKENDSMPLFQSDPSDVINGGIAIENPTIPIGDSYQIFCTQVSHPGHFYVRILNEKHRQLLKAMNDFYRTDEHIELSIDVLKTGQYFAAKRQLDSDRSQWIRVELMHIDSVDSINCSLIDDGGFGVFKLNLLQPLYNRFRSIPKQAIRCSLNGIEAKEIDWLPKDIIEFKNLIENICLKTGPIERVIEVNNSACIELDLFFLDEHKTFAAKSVADVLVEKNIAKYKI
ncbi:Tudor domain-containing protein 1 [Sarcoptes scabiei]|nr:Tudor domain-containing protein 1 [Sarcoptes scabiei]